MSLKSGFRRSLALAAVAIVSAPLLALGEPENLPSTGLSAVAARITASAANAGPAVPAAYTVGAFTESQARAYEKNHKAKFPASGALCMEAVYNGLAILYSKPEAEFIRKKTSALHMEAIMGLLQKQGKAGKPTKLTYDKKKDTWGPDPEKTILGMTSDTTPGWYFYGMALHRAYHSVMLAVDRTDLKHPRIYWIDQGADGFTVRTEVTGKLLEHMSWYEPPYGYQYTLVWQLAPPKPKEEVKATGKKTSPSSAR